MVRKAAYNCLACYAETSLVFLAVPIPEEEENDNQVSKPKSAARKNFLGIENHISNPETWARVFQDTDASVNSEIERLLLAILNAQTAARGSQLQVETQGKSSTLLISLAEYIKRFYELARTANARNTFAGPLLFCYSNTIGNSGNPKTRAASYRRSFYDLIGDFSSRDERDVNSRMFFVASCSCFLSNYVSAVVSAEVSPNQADQRSEERSILEKLCEKILDDVKNKLKAGTSPKEAESYLIALAILSNSMKNLAYDKVEKIAGFE